MNLIPLARSIGLQLYRSWGTGGVGARKVTHSLIQKGEEWESGRVGEWESGRVGEWGSGGVGEWGSGGVGEQRSRGAEEKFS